MNIINPVNGSIVTTQLCYLNEYDDNLTINFATGFNPNGNGIVVGQFITGEYVQLGTKITNIAFDVTYGQWYGNLSLPTTVPNTYPLVAITFYNQSNAIRYADFVRLTTRNRYSPPFTVGQQYTILSLGTTDFTSIGASSNTVGLTFTATGAGSGTGVATQPQVYLFSTAPSAITVSAVDSQPFNGLGQLVQIGAATRDIKSTANETSFTLIGIDTSMLSLVLGTDIKGSMIEAWHGFFDSTGALLTTGGTGGLYKFFTGYINTFSITEQWMEEIRAYVGAVAVNASSIQIIMRNRVAGRYTNDASWQFFTPNDNSMARVAFISNINYQFGKNT